ncbi:hypothetical protein R1flu_008935 [Riccia fluitans]|uniref:Coiled-coil domain-containing protein 130 n=1 Tax=Riccia fluitans TaxID=41844 RepID=A0ABD1Z0U7_9MARC
MSTLAAARVDNFYHPPEWTPDQGRLTKFHGQHVLRDRTKKVDQGILIIRFEMPFNVWCGGCQSMIAKGVRFNAEKKAVGNYYSTKIWSLKMQAGCCKQEIEIQTDPKNCEYLVISGAVRKTEHFDEVDAETMLLPEQGDREKLVDPMYKLEHMGANLQKGKEQEPLLVRLQRDADLKHGDDCSSNKALRAQLMRSQKQRVAREEADAKKRGLGIRLSPVSQEDVAAAALVKFAQKFVLNRSNKRAEIKLSSIFSNCNTSLSERKKVCFLTVTPLWTTSHTAMAQPLSLESGRHSALLPLLILILISLNLTSGLRHDPLSGSNFDHAIEVRQFPQEQLEAKEQAFLIKLPKPVKEADQLELDNCKKLSSQDGYDQCIHDRRALVAFTQDYGPGSNSNPVIGAPTNSRDIVETILSLE